MTYIKTFLFLLILSFGTSAVAQGYGTFDPVVEPAGGTIPDSPSTVYLPLIYDGGLSNLSPFMPTLEGFTVVSEVDEQDDRSRHLGRTFSGPSSDVGIDLYYYFGDVANAEVDYVDTAAFLIDTEGFAVHGNPGIGSQSMRLIKENRFVVLFNDASFLVLVGTIGSSAEDANAYARLVADSLP